MDCNSYSYAPYMLDGEDKNIEEYENDDMQMSRWTEGRRGRNIYFVQAMSYDGQLDVYEYFMKEETAKELYQLIYDNYTCSPPDARTLYKQIHRLHRIDRRTA